MKLRWKIKQPLFKYWAVVPTILILVVLTLYPVLQLVRMSVSDIEYVEGQMEWTFVGMKNLRTMLKDSVVPVAIKNTLTYVILVVFIESFLGLILAFLVNQVKRFATAFRAILMLPLLIPPVAIGSIWRLLYDYNYGAINKILALVGLSGPAWLANPNLAFPAVVVVDIWHWTSFMFLIMLAGVTSIPVGLYEAARVDGASEFKVYWKIVMPLMSKTIIVGMMLRTIFAFKVFDQIYLLTSGGPGTTTEVISMYIYKVFFGQFRLGYGSLLALVLAIIMVIFVIVYRVTILKVGKEV